MLNHFTDSILSIVQPIKKPTKTQKTIADQRQFVLPPAKRVDTGQLPAYIQEVNYNRQIDGRFLMFFCK